MHFLVVIFVNRNVTYCNRFMQNRLQLNVLTIANLINFVKKNKIICNIAIIKFLYFIDFLCLNGTLKTARYLDITHVYATVRRRFVILVDFAKRLFFFCLFNKFLSKNLKDSLYIYVRVAYNF